MSRSSVAPWVLFPVLYAVGVVLIVVALPLYRQRVPRNSLYGVRFAATLADDRVWYPINARGGRDLIAIACGYMLALSCTAVAARTWAPRSRSLAPVGVVVLLAVAVIVDAIILWRAAERLKRA